MFLMEFNQYDKDERVGEAARRGRRGEKKRKKEKKMRHRVVQVKTGERKKQPRLHLSTPEGGGIGRRLS